MKRNKLATLAIVTSVTFGYAGDAMAHGNCPPKPKRTQPVTVGYNNRVSPEPKRVNCPTCVEPTEPIDTDDDNGPFNNPTEPNVQNNAQHGYTVYMPMMFAINAQPTQRTTRIGGR